MLVCCLLRLVESPPGTVFLGGQDVTSLDLATLRKCFAFVPQLHTLFSRSLRENVAFGRTTATDEQVLGALGAASFEKDLAVLPSGLATPIGERGVMLSGGQKQRVSIARALMLEAPILVLDDALSSVDAETEARILESLSRRGLGQTRVVVAHRLAAVQRADVIIVLQDGQVVERGTHAELLAHGGWYARTVRLQELEHALGMDGARTVATP